MSRRHLLVADQPVLRDHRIGGTPVLAAAAQIDHLLAACEAAQPGGSWRLEQVAFLAPLRVEPGAPVEIETVLTTDGECTLGSRPADAVTPTPHSRARAVRSPLAPPHYLDLAELRAGCADEVPLSVVADWRRASGIEYGPTFQVIRSVHRGPDRMVALLRAPEQPGEPAMVPPPLLDSVFQLLGLLDAGASGGCLPWYVGRIDVRRRISGTVVALVERTGSGGAVRGRATVCNQQGEVLLELDRIVLKGATPTDPAGRTRSTPTDPAGRTTPADPAESTRSTPAGGRSVPAGSVTALTWAATEPTPEPAPDGGPIWLVTREAVGTDPVDGLVRLDPADLTTDRVDELRAGARPAEVVYVAPRDVTDPATATGFLQGVFTLLRRLAGQPPLPAVTIVTNAAQQLTPDEPVEPAQAALWGLARTLRIEHPQTRVRLVDVGLDGTAEPPTLDELRHQQPELAWRDGTWYAPTVTPVDGTGTGEPRRIAGGRFLITGGLGGIGLHVAEHLAGAGCAHLTLVGRTVPSEGPTRDRLDRLADACELRILGVDVRTLAEVPHERYDGVFHAAGVLRDGLVRSLTADRIDEVYAPKLGGVHALDAAFPDAARPGFVVLFSSVSAVYGNLGQGSYGSANAYLDGYAARRRAAGESWYSLGWGLWRVGMGEPIADAAAARGVPALTADEGVALLRHVLDLPPANYVLSAVREPKDAPMTPVSSVEARLWPALSAILKKTLHVAEVSPQDNLLELGLDSMMAVEVSAALAAEGLDVDPATFFDHADVDALLRHLEQQPRQAAATPDGVSPAPVAPAPVAVAPVAVAPVVPAAVAPARPVAPVPVERPVPAAVGQPETPAFVPDWDRFRAVDSAAPPDRYAASSRAGTVPASRPATAGPAPVTRPAAPNGHHPAPNGHAPAAPNGHRPAPALTGPAPTTGRPVDPFGPSAGGAGVPRRTLPGRLGDRPDGSFLDRRIDALSVDDRQVIAQDGYFYEPVIEESKGAWIKFDGRWFLNFASYSYLGLIGHDYIDHQAQRALEKHGTGAHGVRLLAGTLHLHRELELAIARFLGTEDAIVYTSGYMANVATVGALVGPGDVVIGDVYNHASILDGYRLSGAKVITYAHNDLADLERALRKAGDAGRLVVTDAVFSMDGDVADLPGILELCERYDAPLMVDEAHSLGVLGATGRGITEHFGIDPNRVPVKMGTLSKTVPSTGGYVAGSADLIFALKNNARGWMFSAAGTPMQVAAARAAIEVISAAPNLPDDLRALTDRYRAQLRGLGFDTLASETPVVPIICASSEQAQEMARLCQQEGIFVQPIVYPTVPKALPRLRTIVNLSHSADDLDQAVAVFAKAGRQVGLIA
ncbi:aminotransferase class I/II-fold pyridoxal phosphate-dependent enzyme [Micromonospora cathayae]|uniref:8-amino-7-oxononanoate synthase n=1 Tax=Micromonospora cathayae TaxID=3028804 RepID=A0ABY7ZKT2_9ACTN|nr:aminotransferase class I/II-fold pyridoxal phosphate-dependent enzyme [Micromonospora sp. HUAS 3]WDZ83560.1 aminotransferase class I/II-fold pyridoxal phosphate-dependent enzyme [Micromonospora sp. HUAS 3]